MFVFLIVDVEIVGDFMPHFLALFVLVVEIYAADVLANQSFRALRDKAARVVTGQTRIQRNAHRFTVLAFDNHRNDVGLIEFHVFQVLNPIVFDVLLQASRFLADGNERKEAVTTVDIEQFRNRSDFVRGIIFTIPG